ncbi:hypothetical protein MNBD_NITROSPINAE04-2266 [hydrothermal vent metagenome]|uniref:Uncharacterized protein n=1 Tax=hydrothermal vent metagenome TaxID=652676 RepID=A0A3B1CWA1_9ZZZZ
MLRLGSPFRVTRRIVQAPHSVVLNGADAQ